MCLQMQVRSEPWMLPFWKSYIRKLWLFWGICFLSMLWLCPGLRDNCEGALNTSRWQPDRLRLILPISSIITVNGGKTRDFFCSPSIAWKLNAINRIAWNTGTSVQLLGGGGLCSPSVVGLITFVQRHSFDERQPLIMWQHLWEPQVCRKDLRARYPRSLRLSCVSIAGLLSPGLLMALQRGLWRQVSDSGDKTTRPPSSAADPFNFACSLINSSVQASSQMSLRAGTRCPIKCPGMPHSPPGAALLPIWMPPDFDRPPLRRPNWCRNILCWSSSSSIILFETLLDESSWFSLAAAERLVAYWDLTRGPIFPHST